MESTGCSNRREQDDDRAHEQARRRLPAAPRAGRRSAAAVQARRARRGDPRAHRRRPARGGRRRRGRRPERARAPRPARGDRGRRRRSGRRPTGQAGKLEIAALVVLAVPFVGWLVGIPLLLLSQAWAGREKAMAALLVFVPLLLGFVLALSGSESRAAPRPRRYARESRRARGSGRSRPRILIGGFLGGVVASVYLALRLRRGAQPTSAGGLAGRRERGREPVLREPRPVGRDRPAVLDDREDVAVADEAGERRGGARRAGLRDHLPPGGSALEPVLERPVDAGDCERGEEGVSQRPCASPASSSATRAFAVSRSRRERPEPSASRTPASGTPAALERGAHHAHARGRRAPRRRGARRAASRAPRR